MKIGILSLSRKNLGDKTRNQRFCEILREMGSDAVVINPLLNGDELLPSARLSSTFAAVRSKLWQTALRTPLTRMSALHRLAYEYLRETRLKNVMRIVRDENVDLLQAETHFAAEIALSVKREAGIPFIFDMHDLSTMEEYKTVHNPHERFLSYFKKRETEMILNADEIFVVSNAMKESLESSYGLRNISVVPNGSDPYPGLRKTHSVPLNVIYAGAFEYFERVDDYLDAVEIAASEDYTFYLVGDGTLKAPITNRIKDENLPVKYLGCLPRDDLRELLKKMHIGIAPRADADCQRFNFSVKTFEYLSMGMPVICADIDESSQTVGHNDCGTLVPPENPEAIAEALELYKNERLWTRHSQNGMKLVENKFSWKNIIGSARHVYEKYAH